MVKMFSVPIIGAFNYSNSVREILDEYRLREKQSAFVRDAIMAVAQGKGFEPGDYQQKPDFISIKLWDKIQLAQQKSYRVDYTYAIAFLWLRQLDEFRNLNKSKLIRSIIKQFTTR